MELQVIFHPQATDKAKLVRTVEIYPINEDVLEQFVHGFVFCDCDNQTIVAVSEEYPITPCCNAHRDDLMDSGIDYVQYFVDCLFKYSQQTKQEFTQEWLDKAIFEFSYEIATNQIKRIRGED